MELRAKLRESNMCTCRGGGVEVEEQFPLGTIAPNEGRKEIREVRALYAYQKLKQDTRKTSNKKNFGEDKHVGKERKRRAGATQFVRPENGN